MKLWIGSTIAVLIAAVVAGCGGSRSAAARVPMADPHVSVNSSKSVTAWVHTTGPVNLVVTGPRTVHDLRRFTAVIVNNSATTFTTGGCTWWTRWPETSVPTLSCLSGGPVVGHSRVSLLPQNPIWPPITRPGLYRLDFTYWRGNHDVKGAIHAAFALLRVVAPVTGQCSSSRKTCVYSR